MSIEEKVGPFRIISPIAKGGMGRVYLAEQERDGRHIAIKVLLEHFLDDRKRSQYLLREVKVAKKLRHPNVIDIYGLHRQNGISYLLMEFMAGGNLRQYMESRSLTLGGKINLILQICAGLYYIHDHKLEKGRFHSIIHRDIKPENILLTKEGQVKVADFGLSVAEEFWGRRNSKSRAGTLRYMSPEQVMGINLDMRTDIYSLGLVIYELLTGRLPYSSHDKKQYMRMIIDKKLRLAPPSYVSEKIPRQFDVVTMKALQRNPSDRYQTMAEMILDLQRLPPALKRLSF